MQVTEEQLDMLRACLNKIYDQCDALDASGLEVDFDGTRVTVRKLFEVETTAYMLYLTISDRVIEDSEVDMINKIMGRTYSLDDCVALVEAHGMRDPKFGERTPISFKLLCENAGERADDMADTLISFYDVLGLVMATSDDVIALPEEEAHKGYMRLLRGYKALNEADE